MDHHSTVEKIDIIASDVKLIKEILTGNGTPSKGMIVRLALLESNQRRTKVLWGSIAALLTAVVGLVAKMWGSK